MTGYSKGAKQALGWMLTLAALVSVAPSAMAIDADHLILSEIVGQSSDNDFATLSSYIRVVNPTDSPVDMSQVYITNGTYYEIALYYNLTYNDPAEYNPGGGVSGKFHAKFPAGYELAAHDTLAISIEGSSKFQTRYGRLPDFELFEDGFSPDSVAELVEVFPGSIDAGPLSGGSNIPVLDTAAGTVILYTWDGQSNLVQDLDYVIWGTSTSVRVSKTGKAVNGESYQDDTPLGSQHSARGDGLEFFHALRRISVDEGDEGLGGNGATGHDETSEDLGVTWDDIFFRNTGIYMVPAAENFQPSAPLFAALSSDPENPYVDHATKLTATLSSFSAVDDVSFFYSVDGGFFSELIATGSGDDFSAFLPAQAEGAVVTWYCTAENSDGGASVYPSAAPTYTSSFTVGLAPVPASKLLITEVSVSPDELEFVEIHNPNSFAVPMDDYYLTDAIHHSDSGGTFYWQIADGTPSAFTVGGGNYNDFTGRFPAGFVMGPGETIVISIQGSNGYEAYFGFLPDLELYEDGGVPDEVPDFRPVFINSAPDEYSGNSIYTPNRPAGSDERPKGIPELEEHWGESLILYHWVEGDDFVTDIDIFLWRHDVSDLYPFTFDKTGITIGNHTYLPDTPIGDLSSAPQRVNVIGESYTRIVSDEGFQPATGSNGVGGRNETGEDQETTMQLAAFSPGFYDPVEVDLDAKLKLMVEAKTFIPTMGEVFEIEFLSDFSFETKIRIFDMEGRLVITLYDSRREGPAGLLNGVTWDGRNSVYERVKAGLYILHLSAVDPATGELFTTTAPVVVATRLSR